MLYFFYDTRDVNIYFQTRKKN